MVMMGMVIMVFDVSWFFYGESLFVFTAAACSAHNVLF